ncbi:DUF4388 domain-containing protein [Fortiea contorta]|uniref:DUF4388 domain-containing protein n=1 Tax=Fortiea contorta TaxID=1892405 RepID=UPI0003496BA3|nr:DUF4388 domain-containing protein [Fortiea contorta]
MAITGNFADFSLPELLQFLDQGKKTGVLYIEFVSAESQDNKKQTYYVWLHQGRIIAASDRLDQKGLTSLIVQRGWISERVISRVVQTSSGSIITPLGLFLKSQGMLQSEHLKMLFNSQVLRPICTLFQVKNGVFKFDPVSTLLLPLSEMTGLSMSGTELILMGLRNMKDWKIFANKLPKPSSALSSLLVKKPQIQLNAQEWQVWEFVNGNMSLQDIGRHLKLSVEIVQQIAFRLIIVGLAEETMMMTATLPQITMEDSQSINTPSSVTDSVSKKPTISNSLLKSLVSFLQTKAS